MSAALAQFVGSLVAILALAWIAKWLGLGGDQRIRDEAHARQLADEVVSGFDPHDMAIGSDGRAAILRDASGQVMIIRRHGNKFAGRLLGAECKTRIEDGSLQVLTGDRRFGDLRLRISDAARWQESVSATAGPCHA